jgi:DNA-binding transcriptional MerR regulator
MMDKSPEAFRTISEVADALDVPPHVLRFWETRFAQVKPVKRGGGRRYYRPEDVRLLRGIRGLLYDDGMTIKGVQKILREKGIRHVIALGTVPETEAEATPEPVSAPAPKPAATTAPKPAAPRPAAAEPRPIPQRDLFEPAGGTATAIAEAPAELAAAAAAAARPLDKRALRSLLADLQALRAVMVKEPPR